MWMMTSWGWCHRKGQGTSTYYVYTSAIQSSILWGGCWKDPHPEQMVQSIPTCPQQLQGEMFFSQTSQQNLFVKLFGLGWFAFLWKSYWNKDVAILCETKPHLKVQNQKETAKNNLDITNSPALNGGRRHDLWAGVEEPCWMLRQEYSHKHLSPCV